MADGIYNLDPSLDATKDQLLFDNGEHRVVYLGTQGSGRGDVEVNSYLIIDSGKGLLVDPGGYNVFPKVIANISKYIHPSNVQYIYMCHQDPDVAGSIPIWRKMTKAKLVVHWLWVRFLPHFGFEEVESVAIALPDEGDSIRLGSCSIQFIPAHYLHSPGHFSVYDPVSRFLFTGDIGINMLERPQIVYDNLEAHLSNMRTLHERLMPSSKALVKWVQRVRRMEIEAILPQHGAIVTKDQINRFLSFLEGLRCGVDKE
ncbi:beta-lactamase domain protein [Thermosulfidibacter takaii ABI70S6]|uniref:Beta-lactamase domain protein n=1 Tax=Thermosulfidibacter takaii (strain DSM 17441 / JCM 13301 / NBRC 103674 / ABI70S6) TaxID=1298851 RepID=A0A0S3QUI7_THET7|nr:MBL fold metallo-hydrolase [Thermosulfidibacter takaii]BAT71978.1 beta-lactamase domain protein [Thermosulfidibacter takaii ABI70S6]